MGCKSDLLPIDIPVQQMRDGQIAVITQWSNSIQDIVGKVVQRYRNCIVVLGENSNHAFENVCTSPGNENCRVRLMKPGDAICIEDIVTR